jgi:hypothetical protein
MRNSVGQIENAAIFEDFDPPDFSFVCPQCIPWLEGKLAIKSAKLRSAKTVARCPGSEHAQSLPGLEPEAAGDLWPHAAGSRSGRLQVFSPEQGHDDPVR